MNSFILLERHDAAKETPPNNVIVLAFEKDSYDPAFAAYVVEAHGKKMWCTLNGGYYYPDEIDSWAYMPGYNTH